MDANVFVEKLKADGSETDLHNLAKVFQDYKVILAKLPTKDQGIFSLNVMCVLCRNLDKIPSWSVKVDFNELLSLSIDCVRSTRGLDRAERAKTLAGIYHIHKHVVRGNKPVAPDLLLKMSYMPFENDNLLNEYCITYWNIITDRLTYIDKLKSAKKAISKLLAKLTKDVLKVIRIYDSVQFCNTILMYLIKKLHSLYNDCCNAELNLVFGSIFEAFTLKTDLKSFKKLPYDETLDLYGIFNDCLYVIAENALKTNFRDSVLNKAVKTCISILGHCPDLFHCLQTFYLNSICSILSKEVDLSFTENVLNSLLVSCETTEKLGYTKAMNATYPFLNQFLRLFIEYCVTNSEDNCFTGQIQEACLELMLFLMKILKNCKQLLKCENCTIETGLHDSLRISFQVKHFISTSLKQESALTKILPMYYAVIEEQQMIIANLCKSGCKNYTKYYKKLQTDIHNTAISLNKAQHFEYSLKLFDIYLKNEIRFFKTESELKNISRALYNKSICELDVKLYESALSDAYLSLVFAYPEALSLDKHMSLVMDVKAKVLQSKSDEDVEQDESQDDLQLLSILDVCRNSTKGSIYGNLKPFFCNVKFSILLKHEFSMYLKLWPSVMPIAGVWKSLYSLLKTDSDWLQVKDDAREALFDVILETPSAVRTIHCEHYTEIVSELLAIFEARPADSLDLKVVYASLLFLKAEYDLAEAAQKYSWKTTEPQMDPDRVVAARTIPHEHAAIKHALHAVDVWTEVVKELHAELQPPRLQAALNIAQVFVAQFLHLHDTVRALHLAHLCLQIAELVGDREAYVRNAGVLLYHAGGGGQSRGVDEVAVAARRRCTDMLHNMDMLQTALIFLCDATIYYTRCGMTTLAAKLAQYVQARILDTNKTNPEVKLDLAIGRLLEALRLLCSDAGPSTLYAVNGIQRQYLSVSSTGTKWSSRRLMALTLKHHMSLAGLDAVRTARALLVWRRARAAAVLALPSAAGHAHAALIATFTCADVTVTAQNNINNKLKYILGLQTNETKLYPQATETKPELFTPKREIESMLENVTFKIDTSPTVPWLAVPGFRMPEYLKHSRKCVCYACESPSCMILACQTSGLEASTYFRAKEYGIARNYFEGTLKSFNLVDKKIKECLKNCRDKYEDHVVDIVEVKYCGEFKKIQMEILIEAAMFELALGNSKNADDHIIGIYEIIVEHEKGQIDPYMHNEVLNLMTAAAQARKMTKKSEETGLEAELEMLQLSPVKNVDPPKTPEEKPSKPPIIPRIVVKDEEIPQTKRRPIIINLGEGDEKEASTKKRTSKRTQFKIPVPVTSKPVLEDVTPKTRSKPSILITKPSEDEAGSSIFDFATPKPTDETSRTEFFTPGETPTQFFTPNNPLKTYSKKSLHKTIIKNLEDEFLPSKTDKENSVTTEIEKTDLKIPKKAKTGSKVETGYLKDRKALKRATSPGKLVKEERNAASTSKPRPSRLRQPIKINVEDVPK